MLLPRPDQEHREDGCEVGSAAAILETLGFYPESNWNLSKCFKHGRCVCVCERERQTDRDREEKMEDRAGFIHSGLLELLPKR